MRHGAAMFTGSLTELDSDIPERCSARRRKPHAAGMEGCFPPEQRRDEFNKTIREVSGVERHPQSKADLQAARLPCELHGALAQY